MITKLLPFLSALSLGFAWISQKVFNQASITYSLAGAGGCFMLLWLFQMRRRILDQASRRSARFKLETGFNSLLFTLVLLGLGMLSQRTSINKSKDLSKNQANTLSQLSQNLIDRLNKDQITLEGVAVFKEPSQEEALRQWLRLYERAGLKIKMEWLNPYEQPARLAKERVTQENTLIVKNGERDTRLTAFTEEKITNALAALIKTQKKQVYFLQGHGEGSPEEKNELGFSLFAEELSHTLYDIKTLDLSRDPQIPADAALIIVPNPRYDLKAPEIPILKAYLDQGKSMFAMLGSLIESDRWNQLFADYGVQFDKDFLSLPTDSAVANLYGHHLTAIGDFDRTHPMTSALASINGLTILSPYTRSITLKTDNPRRMKLSSLAQSLPGTQKITQVSSPKELGLKSTQKPQNGGGATFLALAVGRVGGDELATNEPTSADAAIKSDTPAQSHKPAQELKLAVVGSGEIATNSGVLSNAAQLDFSLNTVHYLLEDLDFIAIKPKDDIKGEWNLRSNQSQLWFNFIVYLYPFLFLAWGIYTWASRRHT